MIQNTPWILKTAQAVGISVVVIMLLPPLMNQVIGDGNQNTGCLITLGQTPHWFLNIFFFSLVHLDLRNEWNWQKMTTVPALAKSWAIATV